MAIKNQSPNLSFIILANNSESTLERCLESIKRRPEILVVDTNKTGSLDQTIPIAEKYGAEIIHYKTGNFSDWRNWAAQKAINDWIFYLDADEWVTSELKSELLKISKIIPKENEPGAYDVSRTNYYLGRRWHQGDFVTRFFYKPRLIRWRGDLHETPIFKGSLGKLENDIEHWTHTDLESMTLKTLRWSKVEGYLLYQSNHPKMAGWRFLRMMLKEFWKRLIKEGYWKDGVEGWIEAIFQSYSIFMTYVRLWEYQTGKAKCKKGVE